MESSHNLKVFVNDTVDDKKHAKSSTETMDDRHRMYLTSCLYLVGFLDLFGVSLLLPLLPRHARELGASPVWIGSVGSIYGVLQLISGPFVGRLSDVVGRRKILLICLLMTALSYTMNVFATTFTILIISRFPLGIFKHGISTVKAFLAEITPQKQRPQVFGRFNAASSTGFIIGPLFGGYLSEYEGGFYYVATCTSIIFFINLLFVYFVVHPGNSTTLERTKSVAAFTQDDYSLPTEANFFKTFKRIVQLSSDLLLLRFLLSLSVMLYRDNFTLIMEERFQVSPRINGWLISYGSLVNVLSGVVVGKIVTFYNDVAKLFFHATIVLIVTLLGLTFAPNVLVVIFFLTMLSITNPISRVCTTDLSIRRSDVSNTGAFLGISQSVASVSRSLSPFLGGLALEFGPIAPGLTGVFFSFGAVLLMIVIPPDREVAKNKNY